MRFTWDPTKARSNRRKHGISFEEAVTAFRRHPLALIADDLVHAGRALLIGMSSKERVVVTVFIERSDDETRIISARLATRPERRRYKASKRKRTKQRAEPSTASLKEIPEMDFTKARVRRNPFAARIAKEGITVQVGKGRPKKLDEFGGTSPRSVRFPDEVWKLLEAGAKKKGLTLHAALREAILAWIKRAA